MADGAAPTGFGDLGSDVCSRDLNFPIDARAHRYLRVSGSVIKALAGNYPWCCWDILFARLRDVSDSASMRCKQDSCSPRVGGTVPSVEGAG